MRGLLSILFCTVVLLVNAQIPSGLVAHYPFNGNVNDSTGLGSDGMLMNGTLQYGCGVSGDAAYFDGSGVYVSVLGSLNNLFNSNGDFSVSVFIRNTDPTVFQALWDKRTSCSYAQGISSRLNDPDGTFNIEYITGGTNFYRDTPFSDDDCWVHMVITKLGDSTKVYRNGELVYNFAIPSSHNYTNSATIQIGRSVCQGIDATRALRSPIDELMFFDRALTLNEVEGLVAFFRNSSIWSPRMIERICESDSVLVELLPLPCMGTTNWFPTYGVSDPNSLTSFLSPDSTTSYMVIQTGGVTCADTQYVDVIVSACMYCDTIFVTDTLFVWDTTYIDTAVVTVYDTLLAHDTVWVTNYLTDTLVLRTDTIYTDTILVTITDTLAVHDTLVIPNYITDTIVTIDTMYNDTVTFTITDTIWEPDPSCTDTFYVMVPDTIVLHDTAIVMDTIVMVDTILVTDSTALLPQDIAIFIPNAFTPNNDGNNDVFRVYGKGIEVLELKIFDRWGELVFQSTEADPAWDGTMSGVLCQPNVYVYYVGIKALGSNKVIREKGSITLLR